MNWLSIGVVIAVSLLTGTQAVAVTAVSRAMLHRRQVSECMTKQMVASRTISYNEASKVCKDRIKSQMDGLSASNQAKPANAR